MLVSSLALDPIEKKPFAAFAPRARILSVGGVGCTMSCPWCQNHDIAQPAAPADVPVRECSAAELVEQANRLVNQGNIGLAFTYNEPLLHWRDVLETARLARSKGLVNALVTNGVASERVIGELAPYVNAWNIDLKAATAAGYAAIGGSLEAVQRTIRFAHHAPLEVADLLVPMPGQPYSLWPDHAHVEVTTLVVPGFNDSDEDLDAMARFIASVDPGIVWHLTRFFGRFRYTGRAPTPLATLERARGIGQRHLQRVVLGNV